MDIEQKVSKENVYEQTFQHELINSKIKFFYMENIPIKTSEYNVTNAFKITLNFECVFVVIVEYIDEEAIKKLEEVFAGNKFHILDSNMPIQELTKNINLYITGYNF